MGEDKTGAKFGRGTAPRSVGAARSYGSADPGTPLPQGLYDPALDKDFLRRRIHRRYQGPQISPDHRGRPSDPVQPRTSRRGRRRSAHGRRRRHPGANPAQVLCQKSHRARHYVAGAGRIRRRPIVHAARRELAADHPRHLRGSHRARRPLAPRLAQYPDRQFNTWRIGQADRAGAHAGVHRARQEEVFRRRIRAPALHPAQVDLQRHLPPARAARVGLLPGVDLLPHDGLQGDVPGRPARHLLSRSARSGFRERDRAGASALLHQHLPGLVAGASLPLHRAQRRDQHAARQRQLDGGAAGERLLAAVRQGHQQAVADLLRRPVRHRLLRQCARIPDAGRLLARPRHDDDDSRSLGGQPADGRGTARLLRVQRRTDGAVGRSGGDRFHQRPPDRRDARPQRLAAGALLRHAGRPHHHGVRDGRAADRRRKTSSRSGGCSRARCCWSTSTKAGSFRTRN